MSETSLSMNCFSLPKSCAADYSIPAPAGMPRCSFVSGTSVSVASVNKLLYPMRELLQRSAAARKTRAVWLAAVILVALSSFFEILEAMIAQIVRPDLGTAYLGTQGDIWDAQKDMTAALTGVILVAVGYICSDPRVIRPPRSGCSELVHVT